MSAREHILRRVREGLAAHPADDLRRARVEERMRTHRRGTTPARAKGEQTAICALFIAMAKEADASVNLVRAIDVPETISAYLRARNLGTDVRMGTDPFLAGLAWERAPELTVSHGPANALTATGITAAVAAAAETGTVILASGADNPTTLNFLPETHIAIVPVSGIGATYEDAWERLRGARSETKMPRVINFVTGPSRTADIEQTLLMGAHGPRRLHVIVVEDA